MPLLKPALDEMGVLPTREPYRFARHERRHPEAVELIIDGTDRRRVTAAAAVLVGIILPGIGTTAT